MVVAKPVTTKNKFVQIRVKQRTAGAKLSFKLMLGPHPSVLNVLSVNFSIIMIYKVMLVHSNRMFMNAIVNSVNVFIRAPPLRYLEVYVFQLIGPKSAHGDLVPRPGNIFHFNIKHSTHRISMYIYISLHYLIKL